jgi:hypothetical protein
MTIKGFVRGRRWKVLKVADSDGVCARRGGDALFHLLIPSDGVDVSVVTNLVGGCARRMALA